jgi:Arc/MetJ-type ribon-helix-helix transcriptional regulator
LATIVASGEAAIYPLDSILARIYDTIIRKERDMEKEKTEGFHLTLWLGDREIGILERHTHRYRSRSEIVRQSLTLIKMHQKDLLKVRKVRGYNIPPRVALQINLPRVEYDWLKSEAESNGKQMGEIVSNGLALFELVEASIK